MKAKDAVLGRNVATGFGLLHEAIIVGFHVEADTITVEEPGTVSTPGPELVINTYPADQWIQAADPATVLKSTLKKLAKQATAAFEQYQTDSLREAQCQLKDNTK